MTDLVERIKRELASLSVRERAEIAHYLLESLDEGEDVDAEEAWDAELARRAEEIRNGTAEGVPAEEALAWCRRQR